MAFTCRQRLRQPRMKRHVSCRRYQTWYSEIGNEGNAVLSPAPPPHGSCRCAAQVGHFRLGPFLMELGHRLQHHAFSYFMLCAPPPNGSCR